MKKLFSILFLGLFSLVAVQNVQAQKLVNRNGDERFAKQKTTTDSTFTSIDSATIASNEGGIIEVYVLAVDATGKAVTGHTEARYRSASGTITLATPVDLSAKTTDSGLSPATYQLTTSGSKIYLQIKGKLSTTLYWYTTLKRRSIYK